MSRNKGTLLVVDDDDDFREAMELEFTDRGYKVVGAADHRTALGMAAVHKPRVRGDRPAPRRRARPRGPARPGGAPARHQGRRAHRLRQHRHRRRGHQARRPVHYLTKPVDPDMLEDAFAKARATRRPRSRSKPPVPGQARARVHRVRARWRPAATSPRRRGASACTARASSASCASTPPAASAPNRQAGCRARRLLGVGAADLLDDARRELELVAVGEHVVAGAVALERVLGVLVVAVGRAELGEAGVRGTRIVVAVLGPDSRRGRSPTRGRCTRRRPRRAR